MKISTCLAGLTLLAVCAGPLRGDDPESTVPDKAMMEAAVKDIAASNDTIFNQYVDLSELDYAWTYLDAEALADIGISLAEAERILFRNHPAVKSEDVLKIAVRTASVTGATAALEKLKAFAEKSENGEMVQQIKLASQLAGKSRSVAPSLSLDDVSIGAFIAYKQDAARPECCPCDRRHQDVGRTARSRRQVCRKRASDLGEVERPSQ